MARAHDVFLDALDRGLRHDLRHRFMVEELTGDWAILLDLDETLVTTAELMHGGVAGGALAGWPSC